MPSDIIKTKIEWEWTPATKKAFKREVNRNILESVQYSKEMNREISRVFQQANRRIQNVKKSGVYSPAVEVLLRNHGISSYDNPDSMKTVFSMKGLSWEEKKRAYSEAMTFIKHPTSTSTGSREYIKQLSNNSHIPPDVVERQLSRHYLRFVDNPSDYYADSDRISQMLYYASNEVDDEMQHDTDLFEEHIDREINDFADRVSGEFVELFDNTMMKGIRL